jgi:hypothetical protein
MLGPPDLILLNIDSAKGTLLAKWYIEGRVGERGREGV